MDYGTRRKFSPEIRPSGRFWDLDSEGFIVNDASTKRIHPHYDNLLSEIVALYEKHLGSPSIGVYLRGTVARGMDFPGLSDLDDFALINGTSTRLKIPPQEVENLVREHPEVSDVGLDVDEVRDLGDGTRFSELAFLMATQTVCIAGEDIIPTLPIYRPGILVANNDISRIREDIREALASLEEAESATVYWCRRISKNIVRCGFSLTILDGFSFTRDLYPCYRAFSEKYSDRSKDMQRTLEFALSPTDDANLLATQLRGFGGWMCEEASSWLSMYNPSGEMEPLLADFPEEVKFSRV